MDMKIPICEPWMGEEELAQLRDCVSRNWITGGIKVKEFEERIAKLCNVKYAVACSNGTTALYMGLMALGISDGDEVLVPDFTFIASANAVTWTGAKPIFVDIDKDTLNIDIEDCQKKVTNKTKAIMPVHIFGQSADMQKVLNFALDHNLKVIEDAAQGIGVSFKGHSVGGLGDIGCLSFYADKVITTGEGGMVLTNSDEYARKCRILKHQGRDGRGWYVHEYIGYNFRMTDMQAGVGLAQLGKLTEIIKNRKTHEGIYRQNLEGVNGIKFPYVDLRAFNVPFRHNIYVSNPEGLQKYLEGYGIQTRRFFYPLHLQPCYNTGGNFPKSIDAYNKGLSLPSSTGLTEEQINCVCDSIKEYIR